MSKGNKKRHLLVCFVVDLLSRSKAKTTDCEKGVSGVLATPILKE